MARNDVSARVEELLAGFLADRGLEVYKVEYKKEGPIWVLRVYLDKAWDGSSDSADGDFVSIDECEAVAGYLSDELDKDDFIDKSYNLEVSSPGLDRELTEDKDFKRFRGSEVEIRLYEAFNPEKTLSDEMPGSVDENLLRELKGEKQLVGKLLEKNHGAVKIAIDENEIAIPANKISKINLAVVF